MKIYQFKVIKKCTDSKDCLPAKSYGKDCGGDCDASWESQRHFTTKKVAEEFAEDYRRAYIRHNTK